MAKLRPILWIVAVACIAVGGLGVSGVPVGEYAGAAWSSLSFTKSGKLDLVVVVYESKNQPATEASAMAGQTSRALRTLDKWRQYDQNEIPEQRKAVLDPIVARLGVPCYALIRSERVVKSDKYPATDADLSAILEKNGGF